jgi:hypothetical protein
VRREVVRRFEHFAVALEAGDLIVFDGGRHYHRVLPNQGESRRWTIGGFLSLSRAGTESWVWG